MALGDYAMHWHCVIHTYRDSFDDEYPIGQRRGDVADCLTNGGLQLTVQPTQVFL